MFEWLFSGWFGAADLFHLLTDWSLNLEDFVTVVFIVALCFFIHLIFIEFSHSATWFACVELVIGGLMLETRQGKSIMCDFFSYSVSISCSVILPRPSLPIHEWSDCCWGKQFFIQTLYESENWVLIYDQHLLLWTCAKPVSSVDLC